MPITIVIKQVLAWHHTKLYMVGCRTPVCWAELNEHKMIGPDTVRDTEEKVQVIRQRLKVASDRKKIICRFKEERY